ncbi:MAG TPA: murein biosynthesis integral membrane protein MurJ [Candidatus Dormibacteraeota bacterium]|nr:murein biosynthesis integral membrane protein MurJ [Candidatus Dormibacteraeota bacterium]
MARDYEFSLQKPRVSDPATPAASRFASKRSSFLVASGIFLSRIAGLIRDRIFAHYFGNSDAADAFKAAFRIPNALQNLFGEGVLSASFIPVYASLLARDEEDDARRTAGAVAALLALSTSILVLIGVLATPYLIDAIAPGFSGAKRELTIRIVRILFPGAGLFVFSAWCLGILNSHRRFFLSYTAPVVWNAAMIATLLGFGARYTQFSLAIALSWGSVVGAALMVVIQLPVVLRLLHGLHLSFAFHLESVRTVVRNFFPVFFSRGVVQISAYVDALLASLLPTGAVAALAYAQTLYNLPFSLFGMSVSAAELPAMSGAVGAEFDVAEALRARLNTGLRQIAFFVIPSFAAFLILGDVIVAAIYQSGRFTHADVIYVWGILVGSTLGLLVSTLGRLYSSTYYALHDTRTPLRYAVVRVILTSVFGYLAAIPLPHLLGIEQRWGVAGLTVSAAISSWVEYTLLRRTLNRRIGVTGLSTTFLLKTGGSALLAAGIGRALLLAVGQRNPILVAILVLGPFGLAYFGGAAALGVPEVRGIMRMISRMRSRTS